MAMVADTPLKKVQVPDFRNLGVILRIVVIAELMNVMSAFAQGENLGQMFAALATRAGYFEPILLFTLALLAFLSPRLARLPYQWGLAVVVACVIAVTLAWVTGHRAVSGTDVGNLRGILLAAMVSGIIMFYFNWRYRVLSPAIVEARLMALQARIRPHFLFNSLNTVLGLLREDPKRSEAVLENLAELFRALLAEPRTLVPLEKELELARAYIEIEMIRIGPRLQVQWQVANAPMDALVPPMVLQPLAENAVYHGIERSEAGGVLNVIAFEKDDHLTIVVRNPCSTVESERPGNRMALSNIRERLALHFDTEAHMSAFRAGEDFVVQIRIPCRREHHDNQDIHR
jgi:two-component system sensor histidine kinase AlgZ